ncbi:MAG: hypothetical protein RMH75_06520 [Archaeoglobaceae archaeon]|nr:hypothetical protein [Archaeoglobaceae archaeon]MDW7990296.1 hypothetical protein [Archaeoglobaceae archaeon]
MNWILYVGIVLAVATLVLSVVLAALGRWNSKLFFSAVAGILIGSTATLLQRALVQGISIGDPYTLIAIAIVSGFIIASVISFALGNPERGVKYFLAAALAGGFFAMIPAVQALFGAQVTNAIGSCSLQVEEVNSTDAATLNFIMPYGKAGATYNLRVYWGDGQIDSASISPGQTVTLSHSYSEEGSYGVIAIARSDEGGVCTAMAGVNVKKAPLPWFAAPFRPENNPINQLIQIPYQLFYTSPEFMTDPNSDDMKIYNTVTAVAIGFIGIFLILRFASGFFDRDPSESLVDSMKDAILVVVVILIAPYIYQIFVSMCNSVSMSAAYFADLANPAGIATIVALIVASIALGVFSSFFGTLGGTLAIAMMFASVMAAIRYALIKAIIFCVPLLAIAFLFPLARGTVRFFISFLIGLILAGPVAAFVLVGLGTLPGIGGLAKFFAPVIAMIVFPFIFTAASGAGPLAAATPLMRISSGLLGSMAPVGTRNILDRMPTRNVASASNQGGQTTVERRSNHPPGGQGGSSGQVNIDRPTNQPPPGQGGSDQSSGGQENSNQPPTGRRGTFERSIAYPSRNRSNGQNNQNNQDSNPPANQTADETNENVLPRNRSLHERLFSMFSLGYSIVMGAQNPLDSFLRSKEAREAEEAKKTFYDARTRYFDQVFEDLYGRSNVESSGENREARERSGENSREERGDSRENQ